MRPSPHTCVINGVAFSMIALRVMKTYESTNVLRSFCSIKGKLQDAQWELFESVLTRLEGPKQSITLFLEACRTSEPSPATPALHWHNPPARCTPLDCVSIPRGTERRSSQWEPEWKCAHCRGQLRCTCVVSTTDPWGPTKRWHSLRCKRCTGSRNWPLSQPDLPTMRLCMVILWCILH